MDDLKITPASRSLDRKLMLFGFELPDLLAVFILLALLNFIFGDTRLRLFLTWLPATVFAAVLRIAKRGKPQNYWLHWARFKARPKALSAFSHPSQGKKEVL